MVSPAIPLSQRRNGALHYSGRKCTLAFLMNPPMGTSTGVLPSMDWNDSKFHFFAESIIMTNKNSKRLAAAALSLGLPLAGLGIVAGAQFAAAPALAESTYPMAEHAKPVDVKDAIHDLQIVKTNLLTLPGARDGHLAQALKQIDEAITHLQKQLEESRQ